MLVVMADVISGLAKFMSSPDEPETYTTQLVGLAYTVTNLNSISTHRMPKILVNGADLPKTTQTYVTDAAHHVTVGGSASLAASGMETLPNKQPPTPLWKYHGRSRRGCRVLSCNLASPPFSGYTAKKLTGLG